MRGDTSFAHWTFIRQIVQTLINISSLKQKRVFLMTVLQQGSFCVWNCINKRCLNNEAVILPKLRRRVSGNIKPLNQRASLCQKPAQESAASFFPCNKRSQSFLLCSSCLCQRSPAVTLGSPATPCHRTCSVPACGKEDYPGCGAALTAGAQFYLNNERPRLGAFTLSLPSSNYK